MQSTTEPAAVYVPIADLIPWAKNPRKNDASVAKVAASIKTFGFGAPVLARRSNNEIIAGHTRIKAALSLGLTEVPVRYLDLDEERSHLLAVADNRLGELSDWDDAVLASVLADLKNNNPIVDLPVTGFTDDDLAKLLAPPSLPEAAAPAGPRSPPAPGGGTALTNAFRIVPGDIEIVLAAYPDNHFDAVVCDPPYGLSFMGRKWDYEVPSVELWRHVLRVLKPGAALIAFSSTRTYHRTTVNIEDAGFEIRDQLCWLYASGMPKSHDVSKAIDEEAGQTHARPVVGSYKATGTAARKSAGGGVASFGTSASDADTSIVDPNARVYQTTGATPEAQRWDGYGTGLKPAFEPAVLARKPLQGIMAHNVAQHGVGGLAIDASRIGTAGGGGNGQGSFYNGLGTPEGATVPNLVHSNDNTDTLGRWPANVLLDEGAAALLDEQSGDRPSTPFRENDATGAVLPFTHRTAGGYADDGGASRFFFTAKASRRERELGCYHLPRRTAAETVDRDPDTAGLNHPRAGAGRTSGAHNHHPTVKPVSLARYLARLVLPPPAQPGAPPRRLLVPFAGSGSEVIGALLAGWDDVTGIEREPEYVQIANARITYAVQNPLDYATDDEDDELDEDEDDEDEDEDDELDEEALDGELS